MLTSFKKKKEKRNRKLIKQGAVVDEVQVEDILGECMKLNYSIFRIQVYIITSFQQRQHLCYFKTIVFGRARLETCP